MLGVIILHDSIEQNRIEANSKFKEIFGKALNKEFSFDYPFSSISSISNLASKDKRIRIFTWILPLLDGTFVYNGFVLYKRRKKHNPKVFELRDLSDRIQAIEIQSLSNEKWYGAHYYEIIQKGKWRKRCYTLLGWDGYSSSSTRKLIDAMIISDTAGLTFGSPIFQHYDKQYYHRIFFEFNSYVVMSLKADKKKRMIVFDHLSPDKPENKGKYQYYGPDLSYDGLKFRGGKWNLKTDIKLNNPKYPLDRKKLENNQEMDLFDPRKY